jgi:hypothetical protein
MTLDEEAIAAVKEYFDSITQNAINLVYEESGRDTSFGEFMDAVTYKINQFASELVASEVLNVPASAIENFNNGDGMFVEDVQEIIDNDGEFELAEDDSDY